MLPAWQNKKFRQANETPFTSETWTQQLQDHKIQQAILDGTFPIPTDLPQEAQELLKEIRTSQKSIDEITPCTTYEDFQTYIQKIDEKRSPSLSGRHYGHYKTILDNNEEILKVLHGVLEIALQHKIILNRWKKTVTALIEKKARHTTSANKEEEGQRFKQHFEVSPFQDPIPIIYDDLDNPILAFSHTYLDVEKFFKIQSRLWSLTRSRFYLLS